MKLQHSGQHRAMRWANGAGTTHEVVARPTPEAWEWRLSIAEVHEDGPFSSLPGVDRVLLVASGNGMTLHVGGASHDLVRFDVVAFSGDDDAHAELSDGMVRDLNLMVRRDSGRGRPVLRVERHAPGAKVALGDAAALIVLDGAVTVTTPVGVFPFNPVLERASRLDALIAEPMDALSGPSLTAMGPCVVALAGFAPR